MSAPSAMAQATLLPSPAAPGVTAQLIELFVQQGLGILSHPTRLWSLARLGTDTMAVMNKILWRSPDGGTTLRGSLTAEKRVAWSRPVALAEVKAIGRAVEGTVNDVMLAAATGALRHYLQSHGEPVGGLTIRAGLSVNLRAPDAEPSLGNQAGAVLVDLPVGLDGSLARLQQVKRTMDEIKSSPEAGVVWGLLNALGKAPADVQDVLVQNYLSRDTAVIANVPGPGETVYLAGAPLSSLMFWVPALGGAGLCLSIASYAGQAWFGIATDQSLIPDPEEIVAGFHAELEALQHSTQEVASDQDQAMVQGDAIEAMNAMLDKALAQVDALLESKAADPSRDIS